jgi:hypothetical protein
MKPRLTLFLLADTMRNAQRSITTETSARSITGDIEMDESTAAFGRLTTEITFPFMRLPKELRLEIYEIVFQAYIDRVDFIDPAELQRLSLSPMPTLSHQAKSAMRRWTLSMFHVNRAIRKESSDACYLLLGKSMISTSQQRYFPPANISASQLRIQIVQNGLRTQCEWEIKFCLSQVLNSTRPRTLTLEEKQEIMSAPDDMNQTLRNKMRQIIMRECSEWRYMSREAEVDFDGLPLHVKRLLLQCVRGWATSRK